MLVDALGLRPFEPAPEFGGALHAFMADPNERTHDDLWRHCALDLDRLRERMGDRWHAFAAYNVDRARTPSVIAALGGLMERFGLPAIPESELERIAVPTTLIWGRQDLATPLAVAQAASARHGWPLHVIEDCADDPPVEQPEAFVEALHKALTGLLGPGDPGYEEATRLWNGMIGTRPAHVVKPAGTADVVRAVRYAGERGLPVSVRGGGHNIAGTALIEGGLTIDMSRLRGVTVDPVAPDRDGADRLPARRRRPRDPGPRARRPARLLLGGRRGRPDARRRARLPHAALRLGGRQPARGRDRDRRRAGPAGEPRRARRPVLGAARGRRPARRRHRAHLPPARGRSDGRSAA